MFLFDFFIYSDFVADCFCLTATSLTGASCNDVLKIAGLYDAFVLFVTLQNEAATFFSAGDYRTAFNVLHKIWVHPFIVPALLLVQCYHKHQLIFPNWHSAAKLYTFQIVKKSGSTRPIIVADKNVRICMGVMNAIMQSSCPSWSYRTVGFRPGFGTKDALTLLAQQTLSLAVPHKRTGQLEPANWTSSATLEKGHICTVLSFDLLVAFNSVNINHMAQTLELHALPGDLKKYTWMWNHLPVVGAQPVQGLAQGFSHSPTLFAWYLDTLLVKHTNLIGYADNFAGIYSSVDEAQCALLNAQALLNNSGLIINDQSVQMESFSLLSASGEKNGGPSFGANRNEPFNWLGLALDLPSGQLHTYHQTPSAPLKKPQIMTIDTWHTLLRNSNWLNAVKKNDWRTLSS